MEQLHPAGQLQPTRQPGLEVDVETVYCRLGTVADILRVVDDLRHLDVRIVVIETGKFES